MGPDCTYIVRVRTFSFCTYVRTTRLYKLYNITKVTLGTLTVTAQHTFLAFSRAIQFQIKDRLDF
jgi:hypothetical protein